VRYVEVRRLSSYFFAIELDGEVKGSAEYLSAQELWEVRFYWKEDWEYIAPARFDTLDQCIAYAEMVLP